MSNAEGGRERGKHTHAALTIDFREGKKLGEPIPTWEEAGGVTLDFRGPRERAAGQGLLINISRKRARSSLLISRSMTSCTRWPGSSTSNRTLQMGVRLSGRMA